MGVVMGMVIMVMGTGMGEGSSPFLHGRCCGGGCDGCSGSFGGFCAAAGCSRRRR